MGLKKVFMEEEDTQVGVLLDKCVFNAKLTIFFFPQKPAKYQLRSRQMERTLTKAKARRRFRKLLTFARHKSHCEFVGVVLY